MCCTWQMGYQQVKQAAQVTCSQADFRQVCSMLYILLAHTAAMQVGASG
jgi:hypothetical protein